MQQHSGSLYTTPGVSTLTGRERYRRVMHFKTADRPVHMEFGWWTETFPLWHEQGLPKDIVSEADGNRFFGFDESDGVWANLGMTPGYESKVLEATEKYQIVQGGDGAIAQVYTDGTSTIPHYLKFPIETHADWERFRDEQLNPQAERQPQEWEAMRDRLNASTLPVGLNLGSMWGVIRNWMGFENACIAVAEDPEWMAEMMDHLTQLTLTVVDRALREIDIDFGAFWEDMAYNAGPMVSPTFFNEYLSPRYKQITDVCRHRGVDVFWVDCDGNPRSLVDGWLAGGVNGMFPLERAGHIWPHELRETYGEAILLFGGVDKRAMIAGRDAIEQELAYLAPVVAQGGFIPFCDHRCPPDVTYANYLYYLKRKCEVFGIPKPVDYDALLVEAEALAQRNA